MQPECKTEGEANAAIGSAWAIITLVGRPLRPFNNWQPYQTGRSNCGCFGP